MPVDPKMQSRFSSFSSTSTYSHLLYLNDHNREHYLSGSPSPKARQESLSFFSMTSSRTSEATERSDFSEVSSPLTGDFSISSATIPTAKFAENHYPLITSLDTDYSLNVESRPQYHFAFTVARQMVAIHNSIIRALNSSYNHALCIDAATQRCSEFLNFNQILFQVLDTHHNMQEMTLFCAFEQLLQQPGAMDENRRAWKSFANGLRDFRNYTFNPRAVQEFDGRHFRRLIEQFAPELVQQLHTEIPNVLNLRVSNSTRLRKVWARAMKEVKRDLDPYVYGPFILGCQDRNFLLDDEMIEGYPGFSWMMETILRKWYAKKHAGIWQFLPSDLHGRRRSILA